MDFSVIYCKTRETPSSFPFIRIHASLDFLQVESYANNENGIKVSDPTLGLVDTEPIIWDADSLSTQPVQQSDALVVLQNDFASHQPLSTPNLRRTSSPVSTQERLDSDADDAPEAIPYHEQLDTNKGSPRPRLLQTESHEVQTSKKSCFCPACKRQFGRTYEFDRHVKEQHQGNH